MKRQMILTLIGLSVFSLLFMAACGAQGGRGTVTIVETAVVQEIVTQQVPAEVAFESARLEAIVTNGALRCGVHDDQPGFSVLAGAGTYVGFDAEFCRALAVAIFNNAEAVEYVAYGTTGAGVAGLQSGEIDVLMYGAAHILSIDTGLAMDFASPPMLYDDQRVMVSADSGITSLEGLNGLDICVAGDSYDEAALNSVLAARGVTYTPVRLEDFRRAAATYNEGLCSALTGGNALMAGQRSRFADPNAHTILGDSVARLLLSPAVAQGDQNWLDLVSWVANGLILAEELGVTSENVASLAGSNPADPNLRTLLGLEGEAGANLNLQADFMVNVIRATGNYGEIYSRHLEPIGLVRAGSPNALYQDGGLLYAFPMN